MLAIEPPPQRLAIEPPPPHEMSTDVVPYDYDRAAFNSLPHVGRDGTWAYVYYTSLEAHNDALTQEDTARINEHYDIELNFGVHGVEGAPNPLARATQKEYDEAKRVVDGLQPGDTLFIETFGFTRQPPSPESRRLPDSHSALLSILKESGLLTPEMEREFAKTDGERAEEGRSSYMSSAWRYAAQLAADKGVAVVYADADAFLHDKITAATSGKGLEAMLSSQDPLERAAGKRWQAFRDKQARNVLKDYALEHLPPKGTLPAGDRKPKLAMLYGATHTDSAIARFNDLHLNFKVTMLDRSTEVERIVEQAPELFGRFVLQFVMSAGQQGEAVPGLIPSSPARTKPNRVPEPKLEPSRLEPSIRRAGDFQWRRTDSMTRGATFRKRPLDYSKRRLGDQFFKRSLQGGREPQS